MRSREAVGASLPGRPTRRPVSSALVDYELDDDTPLPPVPAALSAEYATLPGDVDAMYR